MKIPEKYIKEVIEKYKNKPITREMVIKDLALSYLLVGIENHIKDNKNSPFRKLIFKGGTLLTKSFLSYHRISEDLDFTFRDNIKINQLSITQKKATIKKFLKEELLPELKKICKVYNFDFDDLEINHPTERKYCPTKSTIYLTQLNIYINSEELNPLKLEINFCDVPFYDPQKINLSHLNSSSNYLTYPLKELKLGCYDIKEIILEKLRAVITRKGGVHERDIYDLFLLFKKGNNIFEIKPEKIMKKIIQGIGYRKDNNKEKEYIQNFKQRIGELEKNLEGEIKTLNLINYDAKEYQDFFRNLKEFLLSIDFSKL